MIITCKIILFAPLLNFLCLGFVAHLNPVQLQQGMFQFVGATACFLIAAPLGLSYWLFYTVCIRQDVSFILVKLGFSWISCGSFNISWGFLFDHLSVTMLCVVLTVSCLVHAYSVSYMAADAGRIVFMGYLSLFTFFMLLLVSADNFIQLFLGWEGVGLTSYLLINFWHTRLRANKAAIKALLINKIGDCFFFFAVALLYHKFRSLYFLDLFLLVSKAGGEVLYVGGFCVLLTNAICASLFAAAMAKSAQIGLHTWLPDAMEGPTPVSALIHAATMVTAGVFLLIRCAPLFNSAPNIMQVVAFIGAVTTFFASTVSLVQSDIKKITAYSTCSQLGYMVLACGLGQYSAGLFHLSTHAFFKAALFLAAGSVVHCLQGEQDVRKMGELSSYTPWVATTTVVGSFSLSGSVFASSFYSKEFILELAYISDTPVALFAFWLGTLSALLTSFYSFRLSTGMLVHRRNGSQEVLDIDPAGNVILLLFHGVGPIAGLCFYEHCAARTLDFSLEFFDAAETSCALPACNDYAWTVSQCGAATPHHCWALLQLPTVLGIFTAVASVYFSSVFVYVLETGRSTGVFFSKARAISTKHSIIAFFANSWYFDRLYSAFAGQAVYVFGYTGALRSFDKGWAEYFGPCGLLRVSTYLAKVTSSFQTGHVQLYARATLSATFLSTVITAFLVR